MYKAVCPNDLNHKKFVTVAYVGQDWVVDENGVFDKCLTECTQVLHEPNIGNIWTCHECGAEATVTQE